MFPAAEDATMLIQRITDEAVPRDVREAATVMHYPTDVDPVAGTSLRSGGPADGQPDATAGMRTATTAGVVRAGALMAVATVVSRATGLLSKIAMLAILGTGISSSAYTVANTLPNIVFELLIGGVLTSVAIPLLTRAQRSDPDGGQEYTQRLLTIAVVGLLIATVIAVFCAPLLARLYLSGDQAGDQSVILLTTQLGRLLLPQIFFYGIAALFGAILNTKERFAANAWAPVLNNIVVIGVACVLYIDTHGRATLVHGLPTRDLLILGIGTTLGIAVQALVMVPSLLRSGFAFRWRWGWDPRLTEAGGLVGWAIVYVLISQVGVVVTTRIANGAFADGSGPTIFSYASLLFQMPYGILGVAVLTAIMPRLSRHAAAGQLADVKDDVSLANRLSAVALLPISAALIVLGTALSVLLFLHGHVTHEGAVQIGLTIGGMAIGLVPLAMTLVQMRVFYAMKDARTPTVINGIMVAVRVPLLLASVLLTPKWVIPGLAMATAFSYVVGAVVGEIWLRARFGPMGTTRTLTTIGKMVVASGIGGVAAFAAVHYTVGLTPTTFVGAVETVLIGVVVGLLVIAALAIALQVEEFVPVRRRILRLVGRGPVVPDTPVTATSPAEMGRSPGPPSAVNPFSSPSPSREQVTERVTHAGAGGPRDTSDQPAAVSAPALQPTGAGPRHAPQPEPSATADLAKFSTTDGTVNLGGGAGPVGTDSGPLVVLAPGATVGGRYRLVSLIGSDDAGNRFWRAKDTVLPRDMAVTLLPDTTATSATVARTLRVGRLHHIGLPQTLDVGTEHGQSYVVGQWVDGATLTDLLAGGPLEPDVATSITAKVSEAVAEAHRNGIALGAINPSLVRVNFDGQVRLSHVIAHGNATPDQDIRAVGGLLYLMLTGTWPLLPGAAMAQSGGSHGADMTVKLGANGLAQLTPAPTRLGREVPANEVRPNVPAALSALAERALHPDDPAGIHAVGAIAALLRQPEAAPTAAAESRRRARPPHAEPGGAQAGQGTPGQARHRHRDDRRVLGPDHHRRRQPGQTGAQRRRRTHGHRGPEAERRPGHHAEADPGEDHDQAADPHLVGGDEQHHRRGQHCAAGGTGRRGPEDHRRHGLRPVGQRRQGQHRPGAAGLRRQPADLLAHLRLQAAVPVGPQARGRAHPGVRQPDRADVSVTVSSDTPDTTIEVRATPGPDLPYEQTTALAQGHIATGSNAAPGSVKIALTNAPKSRYLVVFVVHMAADGDGFKSDVNEISVSGN